MDQDKEDKEIDIPIEMTDLTVFEEAPSSVKERFIAEIKKMDAEMSKLSCDLMLLYAQSSTLHAETASNESVDGQDPSKGHPNWDSLADSPLIEGEGDNKSLKLQFDVSQFDPSEVSVKVQDEFLVVSAAHEEKSDNGALVRQFYREFKFPRGVDPGNINSTLSKDGVLTVQAPLPQLSITDTSDISPNTCDAE